MKTVIKSMALLAIMVVFAFSVSAQDGRQKKTPEERAAKQTQVMTDKLQLTKDQQSKIEDINLKYAKKLDQDRAAAENDRAKMKEATKSEMAAKDAELKSVLTADQYQKWAEMKKEAKGKMKDRAGKGQKSGE